VAFFQQAQESQPIHFGHAQVMNNQVIGVDSIRSSARCPSSVVVTCDLALQDHAQQALDGGLIVDDQDIRPVALTRCEVDLSAWSRVGMLLLAV